MRLLPAAPRTGDHLLVEITEEATDPDAGDVVGYQTRWRRDGEAVETTSQWLDASLTSKGETWEVEVTPTDGRQGGTPAIASVVVGNTPPKVSVTLSASRPTAQEDLVAAATSVDEDNDEVTLSWSWTRDGEATSFVTDTIPAAETQVGEAWTVQAVASDGEDEGETASANAVVANTPPTLLDLSLHPDSPQTGDTLRTESTVEDLDLGEVFVHYRWSVGGVTVLEGFDPTLDGSHFSKHDVVSVEATPGDGLDEGGPLSAQATILNTPPTVEGVAIDPAEMRAASTPACVVEGAEDADGDTVQLSYTWEVNGAVVSSATPLDASLFARGDVLICTATPGDGEESGSSARSDSVTVQNTAPTIDGVTLSTPNPTEADTISASVLVSDADGDTTTLSHDWAVNGLSVSSANTLDGADFDKGDLVQLTVVASDGTEDSAPFTSAFVRVLNTPPVIASASMTPSQVFTNDTLSLALSGQDADGDALTWSVVWEVDGSALTGATDTSLDGTTWFERDQSVLAQVTLSDGEDATTTQTQVLVVSNTPPTAPTVGISPASPVASDDLVCEVQVPSTDEDTADTVSYAFSWTRDGATATETSATVSASATAAEETWICAATPHDGTDDGPVGISAPVTLGHSSWASYSAGDFAGACTDFDAQLAADPADTDALNGKGWCTLKQLLGADAVSAFQALQAVDATIADGWVGMSAAQSLTGEHLAAADAAEAALTLDPNYASTHDDLDATDVKIARARALVLGGDFINAERALGAISSTHGLSLHDATSWVVGVDTWGSYQLAALAWLKSYQESL